MSTCRLCGQQIVSERDRKGLPHLTVTTHLDDHQDQDERPEGEDERQSPRDDRHSARMPRV